MAKIKELYKNAKSAKVGSTCKCPTCGTEFVKSNYQQAFCKSKKGTKCKDKYWNTVIPEKRNNTTRISPASAFWILRNDTPVVLGFGDSQRAIDREDRYNNSYSSDHSDVLVERCEWCECINCRCD